MAGLSFSELNKLQSTDLLSPCIEGVVTWENEIADCKEITGVILERKMKKDSLPAQETGRSPEDDDVTLDSWIMRVLVGLLSVGTVSAFQI